MITSQNLKIPISGHKTVSAVLLMPPNAIALLVLAHGAGAGMQHEFMERLAKELGKQGIGTLRYNFLYMEDGKRMPDHPSKAIAVVKAAVQKAFDLYPNIKLFVGGKSFGGRMTSHLLIEECPTFVQGILFFGFPLHPRDKPSLTRAFHLPNIKTPMLFLQGTNDKLANLSLIQQVIEPIPNARLITFEKADHSFKYGKKDFVIELAKTSVDWIKSIIKSE